MSITTFIPYSPEKNLVKAYNDCAELVPDDGWMIFLDHDAMFTTPYWLQDIQMYIHLNRDYSCLVPITNRIGGSRQLDETAPKCDDITEHREYFSTNIKLYRSILEDFTAPVPHHFSGVCIVLKKSAWKAIGGFKQWNESKILGIDSRLHQDLYDHGFKTGIMRGVYLYHWYSGFNGQGKRDKSHLQ